MKNGNLIKGNKGIAILSILGGVTFFYLVAREYLNSDYDNVKAGVAFLLLIFSCFQIIGGILTYRNELPGFKVLIGCYVVQICAFSIGVFSYMISTGPILFVKYDFVESKLAADVGLFQVAYHLDFSGQYDYFSVNLTTVTIILILIKESKKIRRKESN
ncbi:hypothetical protein [Dyadobacter sp. LHD-138]|uniref:hypothetical protein n=1 Tax=Dyadobacter sp. LHD-138 TaxID=3071413 RepID=UPI0027DFF00B|nr:hypothetical protein [Dyadobacter sp. LHD-138]MDQ6479475.1 hypothetical protein [Dyadobacter sp. LHD-138]